MSAKHTPGPWKYGLGYRVRGPIGVDDRGRETGDTLAELNADADRCCRPPDEIEANGRLMAAAPDLLAALEGLLAVIHDSDRRPVPSSMRMLSIVSGQPEFAAIDNARTALKNAKGA